MIETKISAPSVKIWQVGALCRAVADALEARFNPVAVCGEISGFARASSGHCYFLLKDETGQIRCAMFRRTAGLLDFTPKDGEQVEVRGRLGIYESRGDLQLIVESLTRAGQGVLFDQFLKLKARLEGEGLFDAGRKRPLPAMPRGIGVVTSLGAAALHDVMTALQRRVPHIPVTVVPALVQGAGAPAELVRSLQQMYQFGGDVGAQGRPVVDVILLVRGGGALEDLWAFNDERLARCMVSSPVPIICGVGHETDFTIADFVADLRAPTPTAAAELVSQPRSVWLGMLNLMRERLLDATDRQLDVRNQRLDGAALRLGRPSVLATRQRLILSAQSQRLRFAASRALRQKAAQTQTLQSGLAQQRMQALDERYRCLDRTELRLRLLDPSLVLQRGYAWLTDKDGRAIHSVRQTFAGQAVQANLADGKVDLTVVPPR